MDYKIEIKKNYIEDLDGNQIEVNEFNIQDGEINQDGDFETQDYTNEFYFLNNGDEIEIESFLDNGWEIIDCDFEDEDYFSSELKVNLTFSDLVNQVINGVYFK